MSALKPYLWPRSVAIIGATPEKEGVRGRLTNVFTLHPFSGESYLVSRSTPEIRGHKTFPSISDIPGEVDLAVLAVPAKFVLEELGRCAQKGVKAVQIVSSGFAEEGTAEGQALQAALVQFARQHGIALVGPNAMGVVNTYSNMFATFAGAYDSLESPLLPKHRRHGRVAIASQSGGIGNACYLRARGKEIPLSFAALIGNSADVDVFDLIDEFVEDEDTAAVLVFMEEVRKPATFMRVAEKALRKGTPIIVHKVGQSESGQRAAASHTGAMASPHAGFQAAFRKYGIIESGDIGEMADIANGFSCWRGRLPAGRRMAVLTASGGGGGMFADAAELAGLSVPELARSTQDRLREVIPDLGALANPVDATAQHWPRVGFSRMLERVVDDPGIDGMLIVASLASPRGYAFDIPALAELMPRLPKPALLWTYTPPPLAAREQMSSVDMPVFEDVRNAARTMALMADYRAFRERFLARNPESAARPAAPLATAARLLASAPAVASEYEARPILEEYGICDSRGVLATSAEDAVQAQQRLATAVALKVQSPDLPHKSEAGGVRLKLADAAAVSAAYADILRSAKAYRPDARIQGVLVQPMAAPGVEVILGIAQDASFGPMLMVGLGGILVEVLQDVAFSPVPLNEGEAGDLLQQLKGYALLQGARGAPPADIDALVALMVKLSRFASDFAGDIAEIDLNPVLVHPAGSGVSVVDALIVKRPAG